MHHIIMHLDFVSPYAWLAFQQLPQTLKGLSVHVEYRPVFLGALLRENSNPGPATIPKKRIWIYHHALWLAQHNGLSLEMPAVHPFNPVELLRLALQTSTDGSINRYVAETVFRHVWEGGLDPLAPERLQALQSTLQSTLQPRIRTHADVAEQSKHMLRNNTEQASAAGVFGVPAFEVRGEVFWGMDSLPMLRDFLDGNAWFQSKTWENARGISSGLA